MPPKIGTLLIRRGLRAVCSVCPTTTTTLGTSFSPAYGPPSSVGACLPGACLPVRYYSEKPSVVNKRRVHQPPPEKVDVAVVGLGTAGLMAAATLVQNGYKVACFDSHYVAGGCATQFGRQSKFHFDVGLHYIGDCQAGGSFQTLLGSVGVDDVEFVPMERDGFDTLVFPDFEFPIPAGHTFDESLELYQARLHEYFPAETKGITRYLRMLREVQHISSVMAQKNKYGAFGIMQEMVLRGRLLARYKGSTMDEFLDTCTDDVKLRAVILGQNGDYGLPPSKVSTMLHCGLVNHYFINGAYYPKGGGQVMSDKLAQKIEEHGGTVHLRRGIEKILTDDNGRAVGVRTAPRRGKSLDVAADIVISGADLKKTLLELVGPSGLPEDEVAKVNKFENAESLFMTCLGVKKTTSQLQDMGMRRVNYWVFDSYDFNQTYKNASDNTLPDFGCYITSASLKDPDTPSHSPDGVSNVEVLTVVSGDPSFWGVTWDEVRDGSYSSNPAYLALKDKFEKAMVQRLEDRVPGLTEHVVFKESSTPLSHLRFTNGGSCYGLAATPDQFLENRPGFRSAVPGLYVCGQSTRSGHGVVGAMMGGMRAAKAVMADDKKKKTS